MALTVALPGQRVNSVILYFPVEQSFQRNRSLFNQQRLGNCNYNVYLKTVSIDVKLHEKFKHNRCGWTAKEIRDCTYQKHTKISRADRMFVYLAHTLLAPVMN